MLACIVRWLLKQQVTRCESQYEFSMEAMSETEFFDFFFGAQSKSNNNNDTTNSAHHPGPASSPMYSSTVSEPGYGYIEPGEILDQDFERVSCSSVSSLNSSPIKSFHHNRSHRAQRISVSTLGFCWKVGSFEFQIKLCYFHQDAFVRGEIRRSTGGKKRGPRPKILTTEEKRQKRIDANDRERQRMGQLNVAFNHLRNVLPKHNNDRELSKFETIHLAKNYIRALNEMLSQAEMAQNSTPSLPSSTTSATSTS